MFLFRLLLSHSEIQHAVETSPRKTYVSHLPSEVAPSEAVHINKSSDKTAATVCLGCTSCLLSIFILVLRVWCRSSNARREGTNRAGNGGKRKNSRFERRFMSDVGFCHCSRQKPLTSCDSTGKEDWRSLLLPVNSPRSAHTFFFRAVGLSGFRSCSAEQMSWIWRRLARFNIPRHGQRAFVPP